METGAPLSAFMTARPTSCISIAHLTTSRTRRIEFLPRSFRRDWRLGWLWADSSRTQFAVAPYKLPKYQKAALAGRLSQIELTHKTFRQSTPSAEGRVGSDTAESVRPEPDSAFRPDAPPCARLPRGKPPPCRRALRSRRARPG